MEMDFSDAKGKVVIIGFGRFGQVVAQFLLSQGIEVTAIERDVEQIRAASRFGFRVYYGDGTRLDVLRAAGASDASLIALCIVKSESASKIVDLAQTHFPLAKLYVRAYDRRQALSMLRKNVDFQIRDTYESAVAFGVAALEALASHQTPLAKSRKTSAAATQNAWLCNLPKVNWRAQISSIRMPSCPNLSSRRSTRQRLSTPKRKPLQNLGPSQTEACPIPHASC